MKEPWTVFVGHVPPPDGADVFGAHVGLTLQDLHLLREMRWRMETESARPVSLLDALSFCIRANLMAARRAGLGGTPRETGIPDDYAEPL